MEIAVSSSAFEFIDNQALFLRVMGTLRKQSRIGIDLESNGFFKYPERICLVQIAIPGWVFLIDPLALDDMTPLGDVLSDESVEIILHAGDYDVRSLDRDWSFHINSLFDTSIAAAFTGAKRIGLASVLESALGISIGKDKKLQRSDWTLRPLSRESLDYAADDVSHLLSLSDTLKSKLCDIGRLGWVLEESERVAALRYEPPDPDMAVFRVKGSRGLDRRGLGVLKSLVAFRAHHMIRTERPHFRVIPDATLVSLAANPDSNLRKVGGLGRFANGKLASGLRAAIRRGKAAGPVTRPATRSRRAALSKTDLAAVSRRLDRLKTWRAAQGQSLALDPALIWPMRSLMSLARSPEHVDAEIQSPDIRHWQRTEFETSLRHILK